MSRITLCLTAPTLEENRSVLESYRNRIDLAELRLDCLDSFDGAGEFAAQSPVPLILTLRRACDGGYCGEAEEERLRILADLIPRGFSYVDLEDDLGDAGAGAEESARRAGVRIIRSFHDFSGIPENLADRVRENARKGDISKAAVTLNRSGDIIPFLKAAEDLKGVEKILLAMGERGFFSRVLAERMGSWLTFTSPADGRSAAPGQIDPDTLIERYRFRSVQADWPLYGIIGNPVIQSRSPELHNRWLEDAGLPGIYVPFLLDDLNNFAELDSLLDLHGLSVTIPFKEKILPFLEDLSPGVKSIGACNTFYKKDGRIKGENSDALGFLYPLLDKLGLDRSAGKPLDGKKCTLVGAGGASRGVLFALTSSGADVLVLNRTLSKAQALADEFGARAAVLNEESREIMGEFSHIIVQTTSMGMAPQEGKDPVPFYRFNGSEFVYDIIYKPAETALMARAAEAGCSVLGGWEMLREQGKVQFELFTGRPVPKEKA
jgi:3-dehydroquinate dehydratase / shikimate dehydrogenase